MNKKIKLSPFVQDWIIEKAEEEKIDIEELIMKSISLYMKTSYTDRNEIFLNHLISNFKKGLF